MALVSVSYEKAAALVMYGRQLIQETAQQGFGGIVDTCKQSHEKFKSQLKYTTIPAYNLWAELKAQREAVLNYKPMEKLGQSVSDTVGLLKDYYEAAGLITKQNDTPEVVVGGPETRSVKQFLTDVLFPKKRCDANRFTRSQDYVYNA